MGWLDLESLALHIYQALRNRSRVYGVRGIGWRNIRFLFTFNHVLIYLISRRIMLQHYASLLFSVQPAVLLGHITPTNPRPHRISSTASISQNPPAPLTLCTAPTIPVAQANFPGSFPIAPSASFPLSSRHTPSTWLTAPYRCVFWFRRMASSHAVQMAGESTMRFASCEWYQDCVSWLPLPCMPTAESAMRSLTGG